MVKINIKKEIYSNFFQQLSENDRIPKIILNDKIFPPRIFPPPPPPFTIRSFSEDKITRRIPPFLTDLNAYGFNILSNSEIFESPQQIIKTVIDLVKKVPIGQRFTKPIKTNLLKQLDDLGKVKEEFTFNSIKSILFEGLNAINLDIRLPIIHANKVEAGKNVFTNFQGISWIIFKQVKSPNKC